MNKDTFNKIFQEELAKYRAQLETDPDALGLLNKGESEIPTFEDDPIGFILYSYPTLKESLEKLLSDHFLDYVTGIYVIAPVPTTFKIILHNNQFFYMIYMGQTWMAKVSGKKYYMLNVGERGRATEAIARLLAMGAPTGSEPAQGANKNETAETPFDMGGTGGGAEAPTGMDGAPPEEAPAEEEPLNESKKNLIFEGKGDATLFETALVMAWWELNGKTLPPTAAKPEDIKGVTPKMLEDAKKILKQTGLDREGEAKQLTSAPISNFWKSHGGVNPTTKADFMIGDKAISLKVGPSQLMSGKGGEVTATFYAALDDMEANPEMTKLVDELAKMIDDVFISGKTKQGNVAQEKKRGDNIELNKAIKLMKDLNNKIEDFFELNPEFRTAFAYEAASGQRKFEGGLGTANHILTISKDYSKGQLVPLDRNYAAKLGKEAKIDVNMKSNSEKIKNQKTGQYIYYTVIRANLKDLFQPEEVKATIDDN